MLRAWRVQIVSPRAERAPRAQTGFGCVSLRADVIRMSVDDSVNVLISGNAVYFFRNTCWGAIGVFLKGLLEKPSLDVCLLWHVTVAGASNKSDERNILLVPH